MRMSENMKKIVILGLMVALCMVISPVWATTSEAKLRWDSTTNESHWLRTFGWTIDKEVDINSWDLFQGNSGTSAYTISVSKDDGTDTAWFNGTICVTNNGKADTEDLSITARILNGTSIINDPVIATSSVDVSGKPVIPDGEWGCYAYRVNFTEIEPPVPGSQYKVGVTIECTTDSVTHWTNALVFLSTPTLVNDQIHVDDTNGGSWQFSASGSIGYDKTFTCDADAGENNNTATIRETGQFDNATVTVNCYVQEGSCTYTQGYWKNHAEVGSKQYDDTWDQLSEDGANTPFFCGGETYYEILQDDPQGGDAYYILAHQYIAAALNQLNGADLSAVQNEFEQAEELLHDYTSGDVGLPGNSVLRDQFISLGETLDAYNNGIIGPGHCGE
jgi:hypothetical protein